MTKAKFIKFIIASILAIAALYLPYESLGFDAASPMGILNPLEIRVIGVFVMAALFWILQPFPIWSTSMLVIVLMIVTMSDSSLMPFRVDGVTMISHKSIMATFANPIIMLFLGGFFLAAAATKYKMDLNLARVLLKPFGKNPKFVLLGLMLITAVFSMFMSNTATAAMMLAILAPVLKLFDENDRGKAAFALAIPLGANIGGMGTPIGTPPNAIALGALNDAIARGDLVANPVTFGQWMAFGIPYVIILMVVAWLLLLKIYPIKMKEMSLNIEGAGKFDTSPKAIIVYITFVVCVVLWVIGKNGLWIIPGHGINDNAIAMIPMAVFALTGVITKKDLNAMSWDVLWLVAGGFALGVGLNATGLAAHLINTIPFASWSPLALMIGCGIICLFMANFMSHTSTATLLVPILCAVGIACQDNLVGLGGVTALLVSVAFASSLGMSLPISTPPNALAHATGYTDTNGMAKTGIVMGLLGLVLSWVMMIFLAKVNFFGTPTPKAAEAAPAAPVAAEKVVEQPAPEAPAAVVADSSVVDSTVVDSAAVDTAVVDSAKADSAVVDSNAAPVDSAAAAQAVADSLAAKAAADSAAAAQAAADSAAAAQAAADSIEKVKAAEAAALVAAAEAKKAQEDSIAAVKKAKADSVAAAKKAAREAKKAEEAKKKAEAAEAKKKAAEERKAAAAAKKAKQDSIAAVKKAKADSVAAAKKAAAEAKKAEEAKKKAEAAEAKKKAEEEKKAAAEAKKAEEAKKKAEAEEAKKKADEEKKAAAAAKKAQQDSIAAVKKAKADSVAAAKKAAAEAKKAEEAKKKAEAEEAKKKAAEEKKKAEEAK